MIYGREKAKVPVTAIITSVMPKLSARKLKKAKGERQ